ncbi:L,D-transpeptidase [Alkalimarinus sediminis]|uniref:L,D-transpeptidase n=1 Tax=Alkalimarinus sediminis TaxID=1632866 RepID=A0A9E8HKX7_9ALTE|nr:L,D-transpeptidase [Alkalimarinus sediminis]UZW76530.1 L,D-transpeptidase [Alkalimarinus sediminis]
MAHQDSSLSIKVDIQDQTLTLLDHKGVLSCYRISTALNGAGEAANSGCTPRGEHIIRAMIGQGQPQNAVFVARRPTGEIYSAALAEQYPQRDWILTRILWLSGTQPGVNRLGTVDTMRRYIYIHGTPDSEPMGVPLSHGCIRMRNSDIEELFNQVSVGTRVIIS